MAGESRSAFDACAADQIPEHVDAITDQASWLRAPGWPRSSLHGTRRPRGKIRPITGRAEEADAQREHSRGAHPEAGSGR